MKRRIFTAILALALAFSLVPIASAAPIDTADDWARERISEAISKGFVPADIQDNYRNVITREEFCRMAVRWMEFALSKSIDTLMADNGVSRNYNAFSDTSNPDVLAAFALGILSGEVAPTQSAPGRFNPNGQFTRQQAAVMITNTCRAIGGDVSDPPTADFADLNQADTWARSGINYARANGIMAGVNSNPPISFNPHATFTRQESVLLFNNIDPHTVLFGPPTLSGNGGEVFIGRAARIAFTPNRTGLWQFMTSNNSGDPYLTLYDSNGNVISENDDGAEGLNSLIIVNLVAGTAYSIDAGFYGNGTGGYTLTVSTALVLPTSGDTRVTGSSIYAFTSNQNALWTFRTSNSTGDPYIEVVGINGAYVGYDDDGGEGLNALLTAPLLEGAIYIVKVGFYGEYATNGCTLSVESTALATISASGGEYSVDAVAAFLFTPNQSTMWEFRTSNSAGDPYLMIYDPNSNLVATDDDGAGYPDALITAYLESGTTYTVVARFYSSAGSTTLTVNRAQALPTSGGTRVTETSTHVFIPDRTGMWTFMTSDNTGDPVLNVYDMYGYYIAYDDDGGEGLNSLLTIPMVAGAIYLINTGFYDAPGEYTLTISSTPASTAMTASGGSFNVNAPTIFSFAPNRSGLWEFVTSNSFGDPYLFIYDSNGNLIDRDDDGAGYPDAILSVNLISGNTYYLIATFFSNGTGSYTLNAGRR